MKKTLFSIVLAAIIFAACNNDKKSASGDTEKQSDTTVTKPPETTKLTGTTTDIVSAYLQLKNALAKDSGSAAADGAGLLSAVLFNFDTTSLTPEQFKVYKELADDIKEHAEHIGLNGSDIAHQREHFEMLSKDIYDLVKVTGSKQTLYKDYCPMYNKGKGAIWISEVKEIKNPYFGKKMPRCGTVKEVIK